MKGKVYLVGAGPGDPELLTVKALRLLQNAQAVLHDDLVAPEILQLIPASAQIHNVGKRCGRKRILQSDINFLMVALASTGLRVVRLKGGDPLIFGRAGEEIESLRAAGIPYEIVPGITSALGAAASAQIPLTHRRASSAVVFITAHQAAESEAADWRKFVSSGATLVVYMPGQDHCEVATKIREAGLSGETPCILVSRATTHRQRTHRTTIAALHRAPQLAAPTLLIVGEVVRFAGPVAAVSAAERLVAPGSNPRINDIVPATLFEAFPYHATEFGRDEEIIA
jgi:uroporphyrin-III C-methyltransferase